MRLVERGDYLTSLENHFEKIASEEGHCLFITGESGIGKTALIKEFCKRHESDSSIYIGTCDALFTPRPLAPLYDIMWQVNSELWPLSHTKEDRSELFAGFFHELRKQKERFIIVFEDLHWADEATLDFIKFFARRIAQLRCLFILTYRDEEVHSNHPLRNAFGQLPPDSFSRMPLNLLSRQAVEEMALKKGYNGENVFNISGGNPFYVNEILSSYSLGVPDNIKDSIQSVYNRQQGKTKEIWELLSVIPTSFEVKYLQKLEPLYATELERCLEAKILFQKEGFIFFKHEIFRRVIEESLSPLKRITLNKRILELLKNSFEENGEIERIVHHAKNANEFELVARYAPIAAAHAASVGAHIEASKLYLTAIEYYKGTDKQFLIQLYEWYAYECYLTNHIKEAIQYTTKALSFWKTKNNKEKLGNCFRFLSRLWWLDGNRKKAEQFGEQAIEILNKMPSSPIKAMAYSNMSHLKMLLDEYDECIKWGDKAIKIAQELNDAETLSHALNNVGSIRMNVQSSRQKGIANLQQSLAIALENSFHEHAARAYSNLGSHSLNIRDYVFAKKILDEGIQYCEERDLDTWRSNMLSLKAGVLLKTGDNQQAFTIAENMLKNENYIPAYAIESMTVIATIKMRRGDDGALPYLQKAEAQAFESGELQRMIPLLIVLLEYEWITGKSIIKKENLAHTIKIFDQSVNKIENNEFALWLLKARKQKIKLSETFEGYDVSTVKKSRQTAAFWEKCGCAYDQALALFEGDDDDKRKAIAIIQTLGANAVYDKMKRQMMASGIKNIPRGIRKTTQLNPAQLTIRELEVLQLLNKGMQNKEIAGALFISAKTVDHHISSILLKLEVKSRMKAVQEALRLGIIN